MVRAGTTLAHPAASNRREMRLDAHALRLDIGADVQRRTEARGARPVVQRHQQNRQSRGAGDMEETGPETLDALPRFWPPAALA